MTVVGCTLRLYLCVSIAICWLAAVIDRTAAAGLFAGGVCTLVGQQDCRGLGGGGTWPADMPSSAASEVALPDKLEHM